MVDDLTEWLIGGAGLPSDSTIRCRQLSGLGASKWVRPWVRAEPDSKALAG